jgi:hypothetical protein
LDQKGKDHIPDLACMYEIEQNAVCGMIVVVVVVVMMVMITTRR